MKKNDEKELIINLSVSFRVVSEQEFEESREHHTVMTLAKKLRDSIAGSPMLMLQFARRHFIDLLINGDYFNDKFAEVFTEDIHSESVLNVAAENLIEEDKNMLMQMQKPTGNEIMRAARGKDSEMFYEVIDDVIRDFEIVEHRLECTYQDDDID